MWIALLALYSILFKQGNLLNRQCLSYKSLSVWFALLQREDTALRLWPHLSVFFPLFFTHYSSSAFVLSHFLFLTPTLFFFTGLLLRFQLRCSNINYFPFSASCFLFPHHWLSFTNSLCLHVLVELSVISDILSPSDKKYMMIVHVVEWVDKHTTLIVHFTLRHN